MSGAVSRVERSLPRDGAAAFLLFAFGGGAVALARWTGLPESPVVAVGYGAGWLAGYPWARGPVVGANPATSVLEWRLGRVTASRLASTAAVQILAMVVAAAGLALLPGVAVGDLLETSSSTVLTVVVVATFSLVWLWVLCRDLGAVSSALIYTGIHLVGLPLGGGALNPARTVAPVILAGVTSTSWLAFALPPLAAAVVLAKVKATS